MPPLQKPTFYLCSTQDLRDDDVIVVLMGPTGTGKSNFIECSVEHIGALDLSGDSLRSHTQEISAIRVPQYESLGNRLVLVDTPGFDDTKLSDVAVLKLISDWLEKSYRKGKLPTALLYFHRISDNRMSGAPYKSLRMFAGLVGTSALPRVIIVTTMWDKMISRNLEDVAKRREAELRASFWKQMTEHAATDQRFNNTRQSAQEILQMATQPKRRNPLLHQEERVDHGLRVGETQAGRTLYNELQAHIYQQIQVLNEIRERSKDEALNKELKKETRRLENQLQKSYAQAGELKVPILRQMFLMFRSKPKSLPFKVT